jgi:hypothetical protein
MDEEEFDRLIKLDPAALPALLNRLATTGEEYPSHFASWNDTVGNLSVIRLGRQAAPRFTTVLQSRDPGNIKYQPRIQIFVAQVDRLVALKAELGDWLARERLPGDDEASQAFLVAEITHWSAAIGLEKSLADAKQELGRRASALECVRRTAAYSKSDDDAKAWKSLTASYNRQQ